MKYMANTVSCTIKLSTVPEDKVGFSISLGARPWGLVRTKLEVIT